VNNRVLRLAADSIVPRSQLAVGDGVIKVCELLSGLQKRLPLRFASFGFAASFLHRLEVHLTSQEDGHHE
jgi:hypothetical protein